MKGKIMTIAQRYGIEGRVYAAEVCYYDIEDNGSKAGTVKKYKRLCDADKFARLEAGKGYALSMYVLTSNGWEEIAAC